MKFAVIKTGGKQYKVTAGQVLKIEKLDLKEGDKVDFPTLLSVDGEKVEIGAPELKDRVTGVVVKHGRARKVTIVKYKPKVRYHKTQGHRQNYSEVKIEKI